MAVQLLDPAMHEIRAYSLPFLLGVRSAAGSMNRISIDSMCVGRCHKYGRYKCSRPGNMDATIVFESWIAIQD